MVNDTFSRKLMSGNPSLKEKRVCRTKIVVYEEAVVAGPSLRHLAVDIAYLLQSNRTAYEFARRTQYRLQHVLSGRIQRSQGRLQITRVANNPEWQVIRAIVAQQGAQAGFQKAIRVSIATRSVIIIQSEKSKKYAGESIIARYDVLRNASTSLQQGRGYLLATSQAFSRERQHDVKSLIQSGVGTITIHHQNRAPSSPANCGRQVQDPAAYPEGENHDVRQ